mgnify:CR=1 FL=1
MSLNKLGGRIGREDTITYDDAIPYLLKKPTCTKYWASWQVGPTIMQKDYINKNH